MYKRQHGYLPVEEKERLDAIVAMERDIRLLGETQILMDLSLIHI